MEKIQQLLMQEHGPQNNLIRCSICSNFLSVSPIVHNDTLGSICGRDDCRKIANSKGINFQQCAYETLARFLDFPCMYKENGCQKKLPFDEIGEHEMNCEFIKFDCPFSVGKFEEDCDVVCPWEGSYSTLLDHMEEFHKIHKFENYIQMDFENDMKRNKLFFSRLNDSIVMLLVVVTQKCSYWKVWCGKEIWKDLNYKIEILTDKVESINALKLRKAELIHSGFFKSEINQSWFKADLDQIENFFGFRNVILKTIFYMNGFIVGSSQNLSSNPLVSTLTGKICVKCKKGFNNSISTCSKNETHIICDKCIAKSSNKNNCSVGDVCGYSCHGTLNNNIGFKNLKFMVDQAFKHCTLCEQKVECLSSHFYEMHFGSIFKLDECHSFSLPHYLFTFDSHIFLLSKEFSEQKHLTFSIECLESFNIKFEYKLKLMYRKAPCVAVTFSNFCNPEFINSMNAVGSSPRTFIPYNVLRDIIPFDDYNDIEFKLNISRL